MLEHLIENYAIYGIIYLLFCFSAMSLSFFRKSSSITMSIEGLEGMSKFQEFLFLLLLSPFIPIATIIVFVFCVILIVLVIGFIMLFLVILTTVYLLTSPIKLFRFIFTDDGRSTLVQTLTIDDVSIGGNEDDTKN